VTLGKRLSKDFYLAYETSLSGAFGSLYIFYDLSHRLTLRAQAGEQSALDLIFTVRRD
jgi:translocation and assembly module TamB